MTRLTRRRATTAAAAPLLLAACAAGGPGAGGAGGAAGAPTPGIRSGVTVTVAQGGNQTNADARQEIHRAFAAVHPEIKAELLFVTGNLQEKIQSMIGAGTPPDLFNAGNGAELTEQAVLLGEREYERLKQVEQQAALERFERALSDLHVAAQCQGLPPTTVEEAIRSVRDA